MTTRVIYRIAAVLILLFDLGHTAGYPWSDPSWGVDLGAIKGRLIVWAADPLIGTLSCHSLPFLTQRESRAPLGRRLLGGH